MKITVIGAGYLGLTTAATLALSGHNVIALDTDHNKVEMINKAEPHFYEPGLEEILKKVVPINLTATTDYALAFKYSDAIINCVGTPANLDGSVNLDFVYSSLKKVLNALIIDIETNLKDKNIIYITKSTVPVGTNRKLINIVSKSKLKNKLDIVSCPEFLAEGSAVLDSFNLDRIVIGSDSDETAFKTAEIFRKVDDFAKDYDFSIMSKFGSVYRDKIVNETRKDFDQRVLIMKIESAELVKVTSNAFLATKISFANSVARICEKTDADINQVMDGVGSDRRIGRDFLYAGLGWGGGCFPKDLHGLIDFANKIGEPFEILNSTVNTNNSQIDFAFQQICQITSDLPMNMQIGFLGLTFKPSTNDIRMSPSIRLLKRLLKYGYSVKVNDPVAMQESKIVIKKYCENEGIEISNVSWHDNIESLAESTSLIILATEWNQYLEFDYSKIKSKMKLAQILDLRNRLDKEALENWGFSYKGIGR